MGSAAVLFTCSSTMWERVVATPGMGMTTSMRNREKLARSWATMRSWKSPSPVIARHSMISGRPCTTSSNSLMFRRACFSKVTVTSAEVLDLDAVRAAVEEAGYTLVA